MKGDIWTHLCPEAFGAQYQLSPQILGYDTMCSEEKVLMVLAVQSQRTQQSHLRQYRPLLIHEGKRHQAAPEETMHPCACDLQWLLQWLVFE